MKPLVSIITPCYNGAKYLKKYFESLLSQTYPSVEVIFVNDGSTDDSEEMALSYRDSLESKGYSFTYIFQENAGQSAAINQGLAIFKGEYLNWTDCDDYLPEDSVEKRVNYLENHQDVGLVIGSALIVDGTSGMVTGKITGEPRRDGNLIYVTDLLKGEANCTPCCAMVRSSMFRDSMPEPLMIDTPRLVGQNYSLFIPIALKYPMAYVDDIYAFYLAHSDSHSHSRKSFEQMNEIADAAKSNLLYISKHLKVEDDIAHWFEALIEEADCLNRLNNLSHYHRKEGLFELKSRLKSMGRYDRKARTLVLKIQCPIAKKIADGFWKFKRRFFSTGIGKQQK